MGRPSWEGLPMGAPSTAALTDDGGLPPDPRANEGPVPGATTWDRRLSESSSRLASIVALIIAKEIPLRMTPALMRPLRPHPAPGNSTNLSRTTKIEWSSRARSRLLAMDTLVFVLKK